MVVIKNTKQKKINYKKEGFTNVGKTRKICMKGSGSSKGKGKFKITTKKAKYGISTKQYKKLLKKYPNVAQELKQKAEEYCNEEIDLDTNYEETACDIGHYRAGLYLQTDYSSNYIQKDQKLLDLLEPAFEFETTKMMDLGLKVRPKVVAKNVLYGVHNPTSLSHGTRSSSQSSKRSQNSIHSYVTINGDGDTNSVYENMNLGPLPHYRESLSKGKPIARKLTFTKKNNSLASIESQIKHFTICSNDVKQSAANKAFCLTKLNELHKLKLKLEKVRLGKYKTSTQIPYTKSIQKNENINLHEKKKIINELKNNITYNKEFIIILKYINKLNIYDFIKNDLDNSFKTLNRIIDYLLIKFTNYNIDKEVIYDFFNLLTGANSIDEYANNIPIMKEQNEDKIRIYTETIEAITHILDILNGSNILTNLQKLYDNPNNMYKTDDMLDIITRLTPTDNPYESLDNVVEFLPNPYGIPTTTRSLPKYNSRYTNLTKPTLTTNHILGMIREYEIKFANYLTHFKYHDINMNIKAKDPKFPIHLLEYLHRLLIYLKNQNMQISENKNINKTLNIKKDLKIVNDNLNIYLTK